MTIIFITFPLLNCYTDRRSKLTWRGGWWLIRVATILLMKCVSRIMTRLIASPFPSPLFTIEKTLLKKYKNSVLFLYRSCCTYYPPLSSPWSDDKGQTESRTTLQNGSTSMSWNRLKFIVLPFFSLSPTKDTRCECSSCGTSIYDAFCVCGWLIGIFGRIRWLDLTNVSLFHLGCCCSAVLQCSLRSKSFPWWMNIKQQSIGALSPLKVMQCCSGNGIW